MFRPKTNGTIKQLKIPINSDMYDKLNSSTANVQDNNGYITFNKPDLIAKTLGLHYEKINAPKKYDIITRLNATIHRKIKNLKNKINNDRINNVTSTTFNSDNKANGASRDASLKNTLCNVIQT